MQARERLDDVELFVVLHDVWHQRGGLTRNALHRAMLIGDFLGKNVTVLTLDFTLDLDFSRERLKAMGLVDDRVVILNLFEEAGLSGGAPAGLFTDGSLAQGTPSFVDSDEGPSDGWAVAHENDADGRLIARYEDADGRLRREERRDMAGRLRKVITIDAETGRAIRRLFLDAEGRVRAEYRRGSAEGAGWTICFADESGRCTRSFDTERAMRTAWLESHAGSGESIFQVETENPLIARAVLDIADPSVARVAMQHSSHLDYPHTYGSPTMPEHVPVLQRLDQFDAFVLITEAHKVDVENEFGPRVTIHAVPHDATMSTHVGVSDRDPLLGVGIGRFVERKNWDHVIRAFAQVVKEVPDARFELWGLGDLQSEYQALIGDLGLGGSFTIMGSTSDPASVFRHASYSVLAGIREGMPLVLTESMAEGTPPVAYDGKYGPVDIIRDGLDGLLVPYGNVDALADAMLAMVRDPDAAAAMGTKALEIDQRFSAELCVQRWLEVYVAALEQKDHRVVLPVMTCNAERVRVRRRHCRLDAHIESDALGETPTVRLYLRRRDTIVGARYLDVDRITTDSTGLRVSIDFDPAFMQTVDMKWDAYLSVSLRNAQRFVRVATQESSLNARESGVVALVTRGGNLSFGFVPTMVALRARLRRIRVALTGGSARRGSDDS